MADKTRDIIVPPPDARRGPAMRLAATRFFRRCRFFRRRRRFRDGCICLHNRAALFIDVGLVAAVERAAGQHQFALRVGGGGERPIATEAAILQGQ